MCWNFLNSTNVPYTDLVSQWLNMKDENTQNVLFFHVMSIIGFSMKGKLYRILFWCVCVSDPSYVAAHMKHFSH
jgi:hypothetical protein